MRTFRSIQIAHINAGYPHALSKVDGIMHRSSDHNQVVARFAFVEPVDGDLSGDGKISAYDAALILQYVVGLRDSFPVEILNSPRGIAPRDYILSIPKQSARVGDIIHVPIIIDEVAGVMAGGVSVKYNSTILRVVDVVPQILLNRYRGEAVRENNPHPSGINGAYWEANTALRDEVRFAFASAESTKGQGNLLTVEFEVLPRTEGKTSPLILSNVQLSNSSNITKVDGSVAILASKSTLLQNFPNPFNPGTWIPYQLAQKADVTIRIYNQQGQLMRTLNPGVQEAGSYLTKNRAAYWDGRNDTEECVASGIYFYTFDLHNRNKYFRATKKMVIRK